MPGVEKRDTALEFDILPNIGTQLSFGRRVRSTDVRCCGNIGRSDATCWD